MDPNGSAARNVWLKILVAIAVLCILYFAQTLIIPIVFSALVALLLNPAVTFFHSLKIPRMCSSIVLLSVLIAPITVLMIEIAEPAERWLMQVPKVSKQLTGQLESFNSVFTGDEISNHEKEEVGGFFSWFKDEDEPQKPEANLVEDRIKQGGIEIVVSSLSAAPLLIAQIFASGILILFLLTFGQGLCRIVILKFPHIHKRRATANLISNVQSALSRYIATVSIINLGLGCVTTLVLFSMGVEDAILWGAMVAVLNFVPYIGATVSLAILMVTGFMQFGFGALGLLPALAFLVLTVLEAQWVTPTILGQQMRLNPLIIILLLFTASWIWGPIGVLLAVPLLVCVKLIIEEKSDYQYWIDFIESK